MKVKDLISQLQKFDPELQIVVNGYEGGCTSPRLVEKIKIKNNYNGTACGIKEYAIGHHEEVAEWDEEDFDGCFQDFLDKGGIVSEAIIIRR